MLIKLSRRIIKYTEIVRDESELAQIDFENLKSQLRVDFSDFEQQALSHKIPETKIQSAKYALVALWDELIMRSSWEYRYQWQAKPLQQEYFSEHLAGEGFFKRLSELRQSSYKNQDLIELYYICLCLGFEGMYHLSGREKWSALLVGLRAELDELKGGIKKDLQVVNVEEPDKGNEFRFEWSLKWVFGVTFSIIFCLWIFYSVQLYWFEMSL
ncbi:MAG: type IVB secretion system protein IcmH/DotU [Proteobacteria bacterium]|nr:type IVB secretion system protein IcmH/DotU [Pseudomonadota bacterium]